MRRNPSPRAIPRRAVLVVLATLGWLSGTAVPAHAQAPWDAMLFVTPYPSPYLSDWQINPTIASLTVVNGGSSARDVVLRYEVRNQAGVVVTVGRSDPQTIPAGVPVVFTDLSEIAGSQEHDPGIEDLVTRSGRLPEGDYGVCVAVTDLGGYVLAQDCAEFSITYPDPPMLIAPAGDDVVSSTAPIFQWTPLQVPPDYTLQYVLQIAAVLPNQLPEAALSSNILQYENLDVGTTSLAYPLDGLPLESGKTYAWRVIALDQNGYAASANNGSSEIWTFRYDDGSGNGEEISGPSPITLTLRNDPDDPSATAPEDDPATGLLEICSEWNLDRPVEALSLPLVARILFPPEFTLPAGLVRRELSGGHRVWAVMGVRDPFTIVAYGDCDGPLNRTVLRWIGARRTTDAQELGAWLGGAVSGVADQPIPQDSVGAKLKFGVAIFSLYEMTASGDSLEPVRQFLEDYEVDVQPGFNFYGVVDGNRIPALKTIAEVLRTTTADFELQGFAGFNQSLSAGVSIGATPGAAGGSPAYRKFGAGVDLSTDVIILTLRGALPAWEKPWGWEKVSSLQLGLEVVVKDSAAIGVGREGGRANTFETVITPTLTLVTAGGVEWVGAIGVDFEGTTPKLVIKLSSDAQWQPGPMAGGPFYIGSPELELDVYEGLIAAIRQGDAGLIDWNLDLTGSLGVGKEASVAKLGLSFGRKANNPDQYWGDLVAKDSALAEAELLLIAVSRDRLDRAEARGDTAAATTYRAELAARSNRLDETLEALKMSQRGMELWQAAKASGTATLTQNEKGAWWWRARLSFGNMSLLDFLDLMRKATGGGL